MINLNGASVLITGGPGTFGSAATRYILETQNPERLIIFSRGEHRQAEMAARLKDLNDHAGSPLRFFIGDVRDKDRLALALRGVDYVIHAAALKRVETAEYNPQEAVRTNVFGTQNLVEAAIMAGRVQKVIGISTDKAAAPTTLYGATKLTMERLLSSANALAGHDGPRFASVRYGNVIGSAGSVLPLFRKLLADQRGAREPLWLPITDPDMTRFFWTARDAVKFTLGVMADHFDGQVMLPRLNSVRMIDFARALIEDDEELTLKVIGPRPGEKTHETMLSADEERAAISHPGLGYEIPPVTRLDDVRCGIPGLDYHSGNAQFQVRDRAAIRALIARCDEEAAHV